MCGVNFIVFRRLLFIWIYADFTLAGRQAWRGAVAGQPWKRETRSTEYSDDHGREILSPISPSVKFESDSRSCMLALGYLKFLICVNCLTVCLCGLLFSHSFGEDLLLMSTPPPAHQPESIAARLAAKRKLSTDSKATQAAANKTNQRGVDSLLEFSPSQVRLAIDCSCVVAFSTDTEPRRAWYCDQYSRKWDQQSSSCA